MHVFIRVIAVRVTSLYLCVNVTYQSFTRSILQTSSTTYKSVNKKTMQISSEATFANLYDDENYIVC